MTESHLSQAEAPELVAESHAPYLKVFLALAIFTAMEYGYARVLKDSFTPLVIGLVIMAVFKAGLVGWYFMHLKFEGKWVFGLLIPVAILAAVVVFGLVPDIAYSDDSDEPDSVSRDPVLTLPPSRSIFRT